MYFLNDQGDWSAPFKKKKQLYICKKTQFFSLINWDTSILCILQNKKRYTRIKAIHDSAISRMYIISYIFLCLCAYIYILWRSCCSFVFIEHFFGYTKLLHIYIYSCGHQFRCVWFPSQMSFLTIQLNSNSNYLI